MTEGPDDDPRVYAALMIPTDALQKGGIEILRAGLVEDLLNVHAVPAFDDPRHWGAVLAEIAEFLADLYPERPGALAAIQAVFLAESGQVPAPKAAAKPKSSKAAPKPSKTSKSSKASKSSKGPKSSKAPSSKAPKPSRASAPSKTSKPSRAAPRSARATATSKTKRKR